MADTTRQEEILLEEETLNRTNEQESTSHEKEPIYKWLICGACFVFVMMSLGMSRSVIIYLNHIRFHYNLSEAAAILFLVLPQVFSGLLAPIVAILCNKFQVKYILIIFILLGSSFGISATYFKSLSFASFVALLTLSGTYLGSLMIIAPVEVNKWFSPKDRVVANAIVFTGSSLGALWIGPLSAYLMKLYGFVNITKENLSVCDHNEMVKTETNNSDIQIETHNKFAWMESLLTLCIIQFVLCAFASLIFFKKIPDIKNYSKENQYNRPGFKVLTKIKLYKYYLAFITFYTLWRAGYLVFFISYAENTKKFGLEKAGWLLTIEAIAEVLFRPSIGRFSQNYNRHLIIGIIYLLQAVLTACQPFYGSYWSFALNVFFIGALQGGSGGLLMTIVVDSVGVDLARYGYSISSAIGVFTSGFGTQLYGIAGDLICKHYYDKSRNTFLKLEENYVFYIASLFLLVAGCICLHVSRIKKEN